MTASDDYARWLGELGLDRVREIYLDLGARIVLAKDLPRNANSKNQVYLGPDLSQLGQLPSDGVLEVPSKSGRATARRGPIYQASVRLAWIQPDGSLAKAPEAKLIAYPQYPEVRLSGILAASARAPRHLFALTPDGLPPGRTLFLGVLPDTTIAALALPPDAPASNEFRKLQLGLEPYGALRILPVREQPSGFARLAAELCRIHQAGWHSSQRLNASGRVPCRGPNCGGYTLEALLGIQANGYAEPDYDGWEVKSRTVPALDRASTSTVTLFTPEPSLGTYVENGPEDFVRRYGYPDTKGRPDRINFGGCYRVGAPPHHRTGLTIQLRGFDPLRMELLQGGAVELVDKCGNLAAAWPFAKLLDHWKRKHALAAYVSCERSKHEAGKFRYGKQVLRATGAQFRKVLLAIADGRIAYDPGIKLEGATSPRPRIKRRSQFRIASTFVGSLYESAEIVNVCAITSTRP